MVRKIVVKEAGDDGIISNLLVLVVAKVFGSIRLGWAGVGCFCSVSQGMGNNQLFS